MLPVRLSLVLAAAVLGLASVASAVGLLIVAVTADAAISNRWGYEWENADSDLVGYVCVWLVLTVPTVLGWRALVRSARSPNSPVPRSPEGLRARVARLRASS